MRTITMEYQRRGRKVQRTTQVPENFAEMSPRQFLAFIRLSQNWITGEEFFIQYYDLTPKVLKRLNSLQLFELIQLLNCLDNGKAQNNRFYLQELPGGLKAPADKLSGVSLQQFMTVDTFFSWYLTKKNDAYLNSAVAALYLRDDESYFPTDNNKVLNLAQRTEEVAQLPKDLCYAIMVNWVLIKTWLSRTYVHLFPSVPAEPTPPPHAAKSRPTDWLAIFDAFVGDNIAHIDAYKQLPCMDAFRILNRKIKESKK